MASSAASSELSVSQTITPRSSPPPSSFTRTGTPPTSCTIALRSPALLAITVAGTEMPCADSSCRQRILLRAWAMAAAVFITGTPEHPVLVHHRQAVAGDGLGDAGEHHVREHEPPPPVEEVSARPVEVHLHLHRVQHPDRVPARTRRGHQPGGGRHRDGAREDGQSHGRRRRYDPGARAGKQSAGVPAPAPASGGARRGEAQRTFRIRICTFTGFAAVDAFSWSQSGLPATNSTAGPGLSGDRRRLGRRDVDPGVGAGLVGRAVHQHAEQRHVGRDLGEEPLAHAGHRRGDLLQDLARGSRRRWPGSTAWCTARSPGRTGCRNRRAGSAASPGTPADTARRPARRSAAGCRAPWQSPPPRRTPRRTSAPASPPGTAPPSPSCRRRGSPRRRTGDVRRAVVERGAERALTGARAGDARQRRVAVGQPVGEEDDDLVARGVVHQRLDRPQEGQARRGGRPAARPGGPGRVAALIVSSAGPGRIGGCLQGRVVVRARRGQRAGLLRRRAAAGGVVLRLGEERRARSGRSAGSR